VVVVVQDGLMLQTVKLAAVVGAITKLQYLFQRLPHL
jgi:hypothetical protein